MSVFDELDPPYSTIVADPPWRYAQGGPTTGFAPLRPPPYTMMPLDAIRAMPVESLAADDAHLYLWTTNAYLAPAYEVARGWGFKPSQVLVWCKPPRGIGPGGAFSNTAEFVLYCRRGSLAPRERIDTTWWTWPRRSHSVKPAAFLDIVERVSPGPYVELFARAPRLGWDSWGKGYELPPISDLPAADALQRGQVGSVAGSERTTSASPTPVGPAHTP
jgi:N6-adenosine-specific RNA methylase IME4